MTEHEGTLDRTVLLFSSVQSLSCVRLFATPWTAAHQASLSITNSRSYSNSCPLSQWCHPTISSSVIPFSCPQSFPASWSFQVSHLFTAGGQSIGVSASASVLMNIQRSQRKPIKHRELWSQWVNTTPVPVHREISRILRTAWILLTENLDNSNISKIFTVDNINSATSMHPTFI